MARNSMNSSALINYKDYQNLMKDLEKLEKKFPNATLEVCDDVGKMLRDEIEKEAAQYIETGSMKETIKIKKARRTKDGIVLAQITIGGMGKRLVWYWHFIEFPSKNKNNKGTKGDKAFIRNTVRDTRAADILRDKILKKLDQNL
jgi:hypothetical protein